MANGQWLPFDTITRTTFCDNSQGYDSFKGLALIRNILSRACGRVFRHMYTTIMMDFISDESFNMVVQKHQQGDNFYFNYRLKQLRAINSSTGPLKHISY